MVGLNKTNESYLKPNFVVCFYVMFEQSKPKIKKNTKLKLFIKQTLFYSLNHNASYYKFKTE